MIAHIALNAVDYMNVAIEYIDKFFVYLIFNSLIYLALCLISWIVERSIKAHA